MRKIALHVHLRLLALRRRRQGDDAKDARADPFSDRLDRAPLAGAVPSLKYDADLQALVLDPLLYLDEFHVEPLQLLFILLALEFFGSGLCGSLSVLGHVGFSRGVLLP